MAKSKKSKKSDADAEPRFEEALAQLQQIVEELEDGTIGLEESMQRFEKGIQLLRNCYRILEDAEQKIEILTGMDAQGNPITQPFDASATIEQSQRSAGRRKRKTRKSKSESDEDSPQENRAEDEGETLF